VVETITPGAILDESTLPGSRNNYLASVSGQAGSDGRAVGIAAIDLSTGEFLLETVHSDSLRDTLDRIAPSEVVLPGDWELTLGDGILRTQRERWEFDPELAREELARRFELKGLDGLGVGPDDAPALGAAGALLRYIGELSPPDCCTSIVPRSAARALPLDRRDDPSESRAG
jgi:DNA mismatch repair protein MutS